MKENILKRIFLPIFLVMIMGSCSGQHTTTETFMVYGNCGMCKATIEKSVKNVEGITSGVWDLLTDQMTVKYNPEIISLDAIKQKIADVGYDSDTHRAKDEVYNSLPGCCRYERPAKLETKEEVSEDGNLKEESFVVFGNCGMCKNTIEAAALATEGVLTAIWDLPKDIISVKYDRSKTSRQAVEQGIAESGYDTENLIAPDEVYNNLPGCCRYERLNEEERSKLKEYATKHEQENLGNDDMYAYAMQLVRVYPYRAHGIATEYLSKNTDWKTKKNMELISLVVTDYEDPLFTYMLNNREIFRKALDKKVVNNILLRSLIDHYTLDRDNVYWNLLHNKLKEVFPNDLADAERAYSGSRINHFIKNGKNEEFFKESDRFLTEFEHDTARPYGTIAYQFSMKTEDRKLLSKAYSWAKIAVKEGGDSFDNYVAASLAKKLDDTRRALVHANAALKMAKEEDSAFVIEKATALLEELDAK